MRSESEQQGADLGNQQHYTYRIFSPLGAYPSQGLASPLGQLLVEQDLIALAFKDSAQHNDLKFMLAMLLSVNDDNGFLKLYPFPYKHFFDSSSYQVSAAQLHQEIQQKLAKGFRKSGETIPEFDLYQNAKGASLPLILGGTLYSTFDDLIDLDSFNHLSDRLYQTRNGKLDLISKALLLSNQNSCHFQFSQQALLFFFDAVILFDDLLGQHKIESSRLQTLLAQLGDSQADCLIGKYQLAESMSPMEYHKCFAALCHALKKYLW